MRSAFANCTSIHSIMFGGTMEEWNAIVKDENWDIEILWAEMCLRRPGEKSIAYVESHDQALVGDKTVIFRLADSVMYTEMDKICHNPVIDRHGSQT